MRATLRAAGYPGTRDLEETVLYPGPTRFGVLEFLLGCVSGGLAEGHFGFAEAKREGEEAHLRSLTTALNTFGIPATVEAVMGSGSCEERMEFLTRLLTLANKATSLADRRREEMASSTTIISVAAGAQKAMLVEELELLPADLQKALDTFRSEEASPEELQERITQAREATARLHHTLTSADSETTFLGLNGGREGLKAGLRQFRMAAAAFTQLYTEDLSVWASALPPPELHGVGPSSSVVLQKYNLLKQVLDGAQQVQDSFAGLNSELCPELRGWLPGFVQHCREKVSQLKHESDILQYSQQRGLV